MAVKVIIFRRIKQGALMQALNLINQLRSAAMGQNGYITGETLIGHDDPQKLMVITTWQTVNDWRAWRDNSARNVLEEKFEAILEESPYYEVFALGAGPSH